ETRGQNEIVFVTCQFEKDKLDVRLVYTAEKKLGGLQFVPPKPAVEYKSPAYVHADKFKSRDSTVGAGTPWDLPGTLNMPVGDGRPEARRHRRDGGQRPAAGGPDRRADDVPGEAVRRAGRGGDGAADQGEGAGGEGEGREVVGGDAGRGVAARRAGGVLAVA